MALERVANIELRARDVASAAIRKVSTTMTRMGSVGQAAFAKVSAAATRARAALNSTAVSMIAGLASIQQAFVAFTGAVQFQEELGFLEVRAAAFGLTARQLTKDVIDAANGQLSLADATTVAFRALQAGLDPTQLRTFVQLADALGDTIGKSVVVTLDMLIAGVAKGRISFAKQAGLFLDMEKTLSEMAEAQDRSTTSFSEQEKQAIALNAVMEQSIPILKQFEAQTLSNADRMNVFAARVKDVRLFIGIGLTSVFLGIAGVMKFVVSAFFSLDAALNSVLATVFKGLNIFGDFDRAMDDARTKAAGLNEGAAALAAEGMADMTAAMDSLSLGSNTVATALPKVRTALASIKNPAQVATEEIDAFQRGIDDLIKSLDALDAQTAAITKAPFTPEQLGIPELPAITPGILTTGFVPSFDIAAFEAETAVRQAAQAERDALLIEDTRVRLLEAMGERDIAEQLAFEFRNERRLEILVEQGASEAAINAVKNAQIAEQDALSERQFERMQQNKLLLAQKFTGAFGALSTGLTQLLGRNSAVAFAVEKAAALASAIVFTSRAVTEALPNIPLAVLVGAAGAVQIAAIGAAAIGGGGQSPGGIPGAAPPTGFEAGGALIPLETREQAGPRVIVNIEGNNVDQTEFGRVMTETLREIEVEEI